MKDAKGHGSDSRGVTQQFASDLDKFAAHQARVVSSVPTVPYCKHCGEASAEGQQLYRDIMASHNNQQFSGWDKNEIADYEAGFPDKHGDQMV